MAKRRGGRAGSALIALGLLGGLPVLAEEAQGDNYKFSAASTATPVELSRSDAGVRFAWPKPASPAWDTALLGVKVDAGAEGGPWVELAAGSARGRQYFEPGARGLRWINLSGLRPQLTEGAEVAISATVSPSIPAPRPCASSPTAST